jgi:hypothetical protein
MLLDGRPINLELKRLITKFQTPLITTKTIFARNYGTAAVISYNLKGIAPPVPPVQCWIDKNLMSGCEAGKNVSINGILQPNACENYIVSTYIVKDCRYLPAYWMETVNLPESHPSVYHELSQVGAWTVQRHSDHAFASIECDQSIEETLNRDCKTPGGIKGITLNRGAVQRWILAQPE